MSSQSFDQGLYGKTISEWVVLIHTNLSKSYQMKKVKIREGDFGFDSYASVLVSILQQITTADIMKSLQGSLDLDRFVESAHTAWINNYIFWKNSVSQDVASDQRNARATSTINNLEQYDRSLYNDIISEVFAVLTQQILEAGMQQLKL